MIPIIYHLYTIYILLIYYLYTTYLLLIQYPRMSAMAKRAGTDAVRHNYLGHNYLGHNCLGPSVPERMPCAIAIQAITI